MIAFGDVLDCWDGGKCSLGSEPREVSLSGLLLDNLVTGAWNCGNDRMADVYRCRTLRKPGPDDDADAYEEYEREARSMLAFHEHMRGEKAGAV